MIPRPEDPNIFELTRLVEGSSAPLELHGGSAWLFVRQVIEVIDDHCQTESYSYRLQSGQTRDSWLVRWEYYRKSPRVDYEYPLAHVHLNAAFPDGTRAEHLHIPTRRVALELVVWHLIAEWRVEVKTGDWKDVLSESISGFDERRTAL